MTLRARFIRRLPAVALALALAPPALAGWPNDPSVNVPLSTASYNQVYPQIVPDGSGGAIVSWNTTVGLSSANVCVQRLAADGRPQWTAGGVVLRAGAAALATKYPLVGDGAGGAIVVWGDRRSGNYRCYAQRVSSTGAPLWTADGVALSSSANSQQALEIVSDGAGGAIVAWTEVVGGYGDVYAQRISADGTLLWGATGVAVSTAASTQDASSVTTDGAGGAIIAWWDYRNGDQNCDVYAQRVSAAGAVQWTTDGVALCTASTNQRCGPLVADGAGGAIVSWIDNRNGVDWDVYAQRVSSAGTVQWTADGLAICALNDNQVVSSIVTDAAGGAIVTWLETRSGVGVYAQRVTPAGTLMWTAGGVSVGTTTAAANTSPAAIPDGVGGAIVTWADTRNSGTSGSDLFAQQIGSGGSLGWASGGVPVCTATRDQAQPEIASDGAGGGIIAWYDDRNDAATGWDTYAQRVDRWSCLGAQPTIVELHDQAGDQGGVVYLSWSRSPEEGAGHYYVNEYWLWRQLPPALAQAIAARGTRLAAVGEAIADDPRGVVRTSVANGQTFYWEYLASSAANGSPAYGIYISTPYDSLPGYAPRTAYMVEARNSSGGQWWFSDPDSTCSKDNLAPPATTPFTGSYSAGTATLAWGASSATDFSHFKLYRGWQSSFVPGPSNLVRTQTGTGYTDVAGAPYWYKLSAVDAHGNEGTPTTLQPTGTADMDATLPRELALSAPAPNPLRSSTVLRLALPRAARVTLTVLDAQGRRVRTLLAGAQPAGEHAITWDGRDDGGRRVADGIYLVRLACEGRVITRRVAAIE
jgi:hypothetical protein